MISNVKPLPSYSKGTRNSRDIARRRSLGVLMFALAALLTLGAGCSDEAPPCGGCDRGETCVANACRSSCRDAGECQPGQKCQRYEFTSGEQGKFCFGEDTRPADGEGGEAPGAPEAGRFTPCKADTECDVAHGFACVNGECSYACRSHADCRDVGHCDVVSVAGDRARFCVRDAKPPKPGELYTPCPTGDECAEGFVCVGAGPGDLDAYCTSDCGEDDDCAAGYSCGSIYRSPCEDACGFSGSNAAGCVPTSEIGDGKLYTCSDFGLERRVCRSREFCASCTTDADCLAVPNQVCARDTNGDKICTQVCDPERPSCPWGNAASCVASDAELGLATCSHRFGSCHGTGKSCEPCLTNQDCGGGICTSSSFTNERWCIDLDASCKCTSPADGSGLCPSTECAKSPSGLSVLCIAAEESSLVGTCYAANTMSSTSNSPQTGCWNPR